MTEELLEKSEKLADGKGHTVLPEDGGARGRVK